MQSRRTNLNQRVSYPTYALASSLRCCSLHGLLGPIFFNALIRPGGYQMDTSMRPTAAQTHFLHSYNSALGFKEHGRRLARGASSCGSRGRRTTRRGRAGRPAAPRRRTSRTSFAARPCSARAAARSERSAAARASAAVASSCARSRSSVKRAALSTISMAVDRASAAPRRAAPCLGAPLFRGDSAAAYPPARINVRIGSIRANTCAERLQSATTV